MDDGPVNAIVTVSVGDDGLAARLCLVVDAQADAQADAPPDTQADAQADNQDDSPADALDPERVADVAREQGVDVDDGVLARIAETISAYHDLGCDVEHVIAEGVAARDGADGWIEWMPGFDPTAPGAPADPESARGRVDHYNRIRYVRVREGVHAATIHPPTAGEAGRDVRGRDLPPTPGRPCPIKPGAGVRVEDATRLISEHDGMLTLAGDALSVSRLLEVRGSVDFSTGNISFDGSVTIAGGVQDLFEVSTTESIVIEGVVGAADVDAGGGFVCRRGIAGKRRGHLHVGGQAEVGYMDFVRGIIEGDLILQREALNCRLTVHGWLLGDEATVVGGDSVFGRGIRVGQLGCERGVSTTLVVGNVARALRLRHLLGRLEQDQAGLHRQRDQTLDSESSRRLDWLRAFDTKMADQQQRIQWVRDQLAAIAPADEDRPADEEVLIEVHRALHRGVRLLVGDLEITPLESMVGPLTLRPKDNDVPSLSVAGVHRPLTTYMLVRRRADPARKVG
ncbi:MAG: DUF342 domain-containing protein [Planctomycetes bacterium]|nr:DUF342 domain-containing protein [Planctomycetota bacterium]